MIENGYKNSSRSKGEDKMKTERSYWVNAPFGIPDLFDTEGFEVEEDEEERRKLKHIDAELESAGFFFGEAEWVNKKPFFQKVLKTLPKKYHYTSYNKKEIRFSEGKNKNKNGSF